MYSNKKVMNDFPMKKLVPFFNNDINTRRYSYTDGMTLRNETRRQYQQQLTNNVPSAAYIEKLQKKLIQTLETNYEVNKKYGNILPNSNEYSSSPKPYPSTVERKRSAALVILRKRTNNAANGNDISPNSYRKLSVDDYIMNDKASQRQQAISVLKRRINNKRNDNNSMNNDLRDYNFDNGNPVHSPSLNNSYGKRMDVPSPSSNGLKNYETNSPYFGSLLNYDMISSPVSMAGMPNVFKSTDMGGSPSLNSLKAYDMTGSNNVSNTLSPISPTTNFMNSFSANSRKSINLGSVSTSNKMFENNRLITNDPFLYDINSCPTSPIGNFSNNGPLLMNMNNNSRYPSIEEANQKIAENQIMIDYLSKLFMSNNGDLNDKDTSLFANNLYPSTTTTKLPPTAPNYLNNELNMNDFSIQSPPPFTSSSSNSSPSPSQKFAENDSPLFIGRSGSQTIKNSLNSNSKKFSLDSSMTNINNFPSPYVNNNNIINSNIAMPTSPYLGNAKVNIASPYPKNNSNNINVNVNVNASVNANININGLTSPTYNASTSSPYFGVNMDKNQNYKRNQASSPYINGLINRGIPSPSPSFSNSNNTSNANTRYMNNASPGLYSLNTALNDVNSSTFLLNDNSFDLQQQQQQQSQQSQQNIYNSKSMPSSPSVSHNNINLFQNQNQNLGQSQSQSQNQNQNKRKSVSSVLDQYSKINNIMPQIYNNNSTVQISQSMLPAYTSTTNTTTNQTPSPNIGAIGSLRHLTKSENNDDYKKLNPLMATFASEKQKNSPLLNGNILSEDFSQLSIGKSNPNQQNFNNTTTLLSSSLTSNNFNNNNSNQEISVMEPKPKTNNNIINNLSNFNANSSSLDENSFSLNENSMEQPYKLFDNNTINKSCLPALSNFESTNAIQNQSMEDSPIINSIEDKTYNNYNIDMQLTSDALSNNNSNNNVFSLSVQHPVLS
ncbi:hypothetical protein BCR32DRAFT_325376 [Anaeromyces robustus]|uniref:Uncharacterized protein n=1 Tax=Anaeromyces robustus TaxID=1754192 RepID=A0A1Y1XIM7_9FUNG|nr:hypothetical protein BCR32DRAFT_325376 [Anaeromyces robustus]|eukprot:ORX85610.1 hypothetical protein BCR32DRAFT_325376 [Anaeromyces robustus]